MTAADYYRQLIGSSETARAFKAAIIGYVLNNGRITLQEICRGVASGLTGKNLANYMWAVLGGANLSPDEVIRRTYRLFFKREPDSGGFKYWKGQWNKYGYYIPVVIIGTALKQYPNSSDTKNTLGVLSSLYYEAKSAYCNPYYELKKKSRSYYLKLLKNPAYQVGMIFYALRRRWPTHEELCQVLKKTNFKGGIVLKDALRTMFPNYTASKVVNYTYRNILGRSPDRGGYQYWISKWSKYGLYLPVAIIATALNTYPTSSESELIIRLMDKSKGYEDYSKVVDLCHRITVTPTSVSGSSISTKPKTTTHTTTQTTSSTSSSQSSSNYVVEPQVPSEIDQTVTPPETQTTTTSSTTTTTTTVDLSPPAEPAGTTRASTQPALSPEEIRQMIKQSMQELANQLKQQQQQKTQTQPQQPQQPQQTAGIPEDFKKYALLGGALLLGLMMMNKGD